MMIDHEKAPPRTETGNGADEIADQANRLENNHRAADPQANSFSTPASERFSAAVFNLRHECEARRMGCVARCTDDHEMLRLLAGPWSPARQRQADWFRQQWAAAHARGETLTEMQARLDSDSVWSLRVEADEVDGITYAEDVLHRLVYHFSRQLISAFDE